MQSINKGVKKILSDFDVSCFKAYVTWTNVLMDIGNR